MTGCEDDARSRVAPVSRAKEHAACEEGEAVSPAVGPVQPTSAGTDAKEQATPSARATMATANVRRTGPGGPQPEGAGKRSCPSFSVTFPRFHSPFRGLTGVLSYSSPATVNGTPSDCVPLQNWFTAPIFAPLPVQ
jgi:hypothetical protein